MIDTTIYIHLNAVAKEKVMPDRATFHVQLKVDKAKTAQEAMLLMAQKRKALRESVNAQNGELSDEGIYVQPQYSEGGVLQKRGKIIHYNASCSCKITSDLDEMHEHMARAQEADENAIISPPYFHLSDRKERQRKLMITALKDALAEAKDQAEASGLDPDRVKARLINQNRSYSRETDVDMFASQRSRHMTKIAGGALAENQALELQEILEEPRPEPIHLSVSIPVTYTVE